MTRNYTGKLNAQYSMKFFFFLLKESKMKHKITFLFLLLLLCNINRWQHICCNLFDLHISTKQPAIKKYCHGIITRTQRAMPCLVYTPRYIYLGFICCFHSGYAGICTHKYFSILCDQCLLLATMTIQLRAYTWICFLLCSFRFF